MTASAPADSRPHLASPDENPSFIKGLFLGEIREEMVFPFPTLSADEKESLAAILDALWHVLAPGGKMLYCTCSVFRAENVDQIKEFTRRHPDAARLPTGCAEHEIHLMPGPDHDGFYYALLQKLA